MTSLCNYSLKYCCDLMTNRITTEPNSQAATFLKTLSSLSCHGARLLHIISTQNQIIIIKPEPAT